MAEMIEPGELSLPPSADPLEQPPEPRPEPSPEPRQAGRGGVAIVLAILSLLAVGLGGFWGWRTSRALTQRVQRVEQAQQATDPGALSQLDGQVATLRDTVAKLQTRLEPQPPSSGSPASTSASSASPLSPASAPAGSASPASASASSPPPAPSQVDLKPIEDRIAALEQRPAPVAPDQSALLGKVQGLLGQIDSLTQQVQTAQAAAATAQAAAKTAQDQASTANEQAKTAQDQAKGAADQAKGAEDQAKAAQGQASSAQAQTAAVTDRAGQAQQLQLAATALDAGHPLGDIAGAPPALTRFATTPPPTEAALRLAFPAIAKQAAEASRPSLEGESLAARMWTRAQSLVTVKQGNRVLVGAPAAATLAQAQALLDAGDLPGALHALQALDPAAAQAMAPWREQAQSLVEARAALAATAAAMAHR